MSEEERVSLKRHTLMQLEEVNRATSAEEYLVKLQVWAADRGLPVEDQWNFQIMMQYCERIEAQNRHLRERLMARSPVLRFLYEWASGKLR